MSDDWKEFNKELGEQTEFLGNLASARTADALAAAASERGRIAALPDCPHCGGKIPKVGVGLCKHCRNHLDWFNDIACEPTAEGRARAEEEWTRREEHRQAMEREAQEKRDWWMGYIGMSILSGLLSIVLMLPIGLSFLIVFYPLDFLVTPVFELFGQGDSFRALLFLGLGVAGFLLWLYGILVLPANWWSDNTPKWAQSYPNWTNNWTLNGTLKVIAGIEVLLVVLYVCYLGFSLLGWAFSQWYVWVIAGIAAGLAIFLGRRTKPRDEGREQTALPAEGKATSPQSVSTTPSPVTGQRVTTDHVQPEPKQPTQYWVSRNGKVNGPFQQHAVLKAVKAGKIRQTDEIAKSPDGPWKTVSEAIKKST